MAWEKNQGTGASHPLSLGVVSKIKGAPKYSMNRVAVISNPGEGSRSGGFVEIVAKRIGNLRPKTCSSQENQGAD
ncbi:MAG: hypothetical protein Ct9H90mP16_06400 [Candidatus Poseidoniales archaeon]|nr:MAG: hypothetical protein Ct9H90mP16_06400 [Candidatus Poseidoniales archaeon]